MYLSDVQQIVDFLDKNAADTLVSGVFRSRGGTLIKLYGSKSIAAFFFHAGEKIIIPVTDLSRFPKEQITNLEEGIRANFVGKIRSFSLLPEFGKVVKIDGTALSMIVPLFGGKPVQIFDPAGNPVWSEKRSGELKPLEKPMRDFPLTFENPLFWESWFIEKSDAELSRLREQLIEKRRRKLIDSIALAKSEAERHASNSELYTKNATLLKANLYALDPNGRRPFIELTGSDGSLTRIELDPAKTLVQNMERFFSLIRRSRNGIAACGTRISELEEKLKNITEINELPNSSVKTEKKKAKAAVHVPYHKFTADNGRIFLVGKEDRDNDELTFKIALPHDIWFHAKDYHGSHVIMKMKKNEQVRQSDLLTACKLAIIYSKAKKGGCGEVWYTERKNVTKKKGANAGSVTFKNAKVIYMKDVRMPENLKKEDE